MNKTPSNPLHEKRHEDWARRVIAKKLGINIAFMPTDKQWLLIVTKIDNLVDRL